MQTSAELFKCPYNVPIAPLQLYTQATGGAAVTGKFYTPKCLCKNNVTLSGTYATLDMVCDLSGNVKCKSGYHFDRNRVCRLDCTAATAPGSTLVGKI